MVAGNAGELSVHTLGGFRLRRAVSVKGCHAVYQGTDGTGQPVAIRAVCADAKHRLHSRLENELASLTHLPSSAPAPAVIATGQTTDLHYLVTQWLPGTPWSTLAAHESTADAGRLLPAAARALAALHTGGVAHGDLSATNILVGQDHSVRFVDFESSVIPDHPVAPHRGPAPRITWRLAAPELFHRDRDGHRPWPTQACDQYSLAALFYRLLTGDHPRDNPHRVGPYNPPPDAEARPLTGRAADRWPALPQVLATALAQHPEHRHPSTARFAGAITSAMAPRTAPTTTSTAEQLPRRVGEGSPCGAPASA